MKGQRYSQIRVTEISPSLLRVIINQNNWIAGEIDLNERVFYSTPRSTKNLFHLFHGDEGGIGVNEEILLRTDFDIIKIKYNDKVLTTTRLKWSNEGIISPYCNQSVDKQIILKVSNINMIGVEQYFPKEIQTTLFVEN